MPACCSYPARMAVAVSSSPWLKMKSCSGEGRHAGNTCWVPCLRSSPCFHLSTPPSPPPPPNLSLPSLSCASISPPFLPPLPLRLASSLHPRFLASLLGPITGVTGEGLGKHSLWCWSTFRAVMWHLCTARDEARMTLLGCHVLPEDIMFTLSFCWKINLHQVPLYPVA